MPSPFDPHFCFRIRICCPVPLIGYFFLVLLKHSAPVALSPTAVY